MKKKVAVLGATGSIGRNTVDVLRAGNFEPVLFSAHTNARALVKLKEEFPGALLALSGADKSGIDKAENVVVDFSGPDGLLKAIAACGADIVVNGISGAAGLEPSVAALKTGCRLALANKETMVMAGPLVRALARETHAEIIPVDSEHTAVFCLMNAHGKENIDEIIITASGGPFRNFSREQLEKVTPKDALAHPTWNMGPKITVESATLANKGLEVIEAVRLFDFPPEKVKVLVHPQSVVHAMVRLKDGNLYAQLSEPDMRRPIHNALLWPEIPFPSFGALNFDGLSLEFTKPDNSRFPMLALAYQALERGPLHTIVYNAANESAVEAFLEGKIRFPEISRVVERVLKNDLWSGFGRNDQDLAVILTIDRKAREISLELLGENR